MQKYRESEIKSFEFSDLQGTSINRDADFKSFNFNELKGEVFKKEKISQDALRTERTYEKKNQFKIDGVVRESRGLSQQEHNDFESRVQQEVQNRLQSAFDEAYQEGLEKGREEGKTEALAEFQQQLSQKIDDFSETISGLNSQFSNIVEHNRHDIYEFVKRFTKWIILKEIDEKTYLVNLLEKLLLELNVRKNLIIKVGRNNFSQMPEIVQMVEAKLGQLSNVRIEIVPEINHPGIILESENGLIDGSMEGVFQNIDKIFEQVLKHE
jgi:flagellar assembly protein FliH